MQDTEVTKGDLLSDEVDVELDVFRASMVDGVGSHVDGRNVVAEDDGGLGQGDAQFTKELSKPVAFSNGVGDSALLRFRAGA